MSVLGDVIDLIKSSVDTEELKQNLTKKRYSSIATRAAEGTLQFPILISNAMDIDTAQMIVKALERNYATFVQTVLSMNSVSNETDIAKYLKKFHQNSGLNSRVVDGGDIIRIFEEGYTGFESEDGKLVISETYNNVTTGLVSKSNRYYNVDLRKDLRTDILNRKFNPVNETVYNFKKSGLNHKYNAVLEAPWDKEYHEPDYDTILAMARSRGVNMHDRAAVNKFVRDYKNQSRMQFALGSEYEWMKTYNDEIRKSNEEYRKQNAENRAYSEELRKQSAEKRADAEERRKDANLALNTAKTAADVSKAASDVAKTNYQLNTRELPQQMLKDNDVKKANELIATTMHARIHMLNKNNEPIGVHDFMIGIKGTMHPIKSEEMIINMVGACKNNNRVFNFLRWTTGEISFFKDFWLNINEMKRDVANESNGASRWWIALKNRRALSRIQNNALFKDRLLPNATIVLTAEEAELIKINYGYDVMKPYFMKKIMETYFLLGFVIVDNSAQIAHFYFDGSPDFESVSFSGLEKENTRDERKFKEMLKVINRN